jgi:cysteine desulfurase
MSQIYLDYAATCPVDKKVFKKMKPYFTEKFANESSMHSLGNKVREEVEEAREQILKKINATNHKLIFTSGGTESNNLAIKGIAYSYKQKGKHIITTNIEHDCVLNTVKFLEKEGFEIEYLNVDKEGFINLEELLKKIRKDTILVSIIHGNNEIGTLQDLKEIGKICKEKNVFFHTDACQSFCKTEIDLTKQNIDLITINAHKIYGPKGVGGLVIKNGIKLTPLLHGGGHEYNLRSGTLNVPGIIGFAESTKVISKKDIENMIKVRDYIITNVLKEIKTARLLGPKEKRLCNNISFLFDFIEGESILLHLDLKKIEVSTGSACSSHTLETNHVIKAIGIDKDNANGMVRITLGKETTIKDADILIKELKIIVERLTKMSPIMKNVK